MESLEQISNQLASGFYHDRVELLKERATILRANLDMIMLEMEKLPRVPWDTPQKKLKEISAQEKYKNSRARIKLLVSRKRFIEEWVEEIKREYKTLQKEIRTKEVIAKLHRSNSKRPGKTAP